ncbi:AMP-binding protein [Parazoarcus communis]|uniref:AMP-binding protein n=1 Tax=Parazoarcus communis SWub3 = DSM 12120 TaxID=1121029 RepID=A0A323UXK7_9RHOO|nr:AMP-binding protein [Parazoarcus communis]NMG69916.1 AMP-binding protein [Parazoarcus communis SWub3 = DSM 12120]PZA16643.1 AMP-binding protein [Azoarcus communis] [Parazoarcus communis SWub3 = DSM 12120]
MTHPYDALISTSTQPLQGGSGVVVTQVSSYVHGASAQPLIGETIGRFFDDACRRHADREALVVRHQGVRLTYAALRQRVDALACGLRRLGLEKGDRIGIWSQNTLEWALTQFATAKAGLVLVNINPAYRRAELAYAVNKVGCRALILSPSFKASDYLAMLADLAPELASCRPGALQAASLPTLEMVIRMGKERTPGMLNFDDLMRTPDATELDLLAGRGDVLQFDDPINIQFTSGTTGQPKGATLSHHNILNNGFFVGEAIRLQAGDRLCIPVPLYHCFGMVMGNLGCLTHGATMVYPAEAFDPLAVLETMAAERCTALYGVPTMFIAVLDHPRFAEFDLSSLRTGIMAGSPCPIEVMKRVIGQMNMREVTIAYGMTETSPVSFQSATDDPVERRVSTVGRVQPHCEVKIIDGEGRIVPRGTPGELCTRGYSVMLGYWGDEARTREAIDPAGWMRTGDLATLDEEGFCRIVGRIKDMVIRGGENIYPREIEEFLYRHPQVLDVQVVGVPDPKYGEELCAWIIARSDDLTETEIRAFCHGQIAHYKIPRYIRFVEVFPMTVTGKIQKYLIREQMKRELEGDTDLPG